MKRLLYLAIWPLAGAALLALSWLALSPRLFFSSDTGLRYIQIQNLIENHFSSLAIRYAPPGLDGDPLQAPFYWARSLIDGEIYLHISSLFPIAAAAAFAPLGTLGLALLPALGSVATGGAVFAIAELARLPRARWIGLASIVATPLLFYALVLWDHSAITAMAIWGIYGVARGMARHSPRAALLGGAALGLATTQRPEFAALALALGAALLFHTRKSRYRAALWTAAGGVLGAAPLWLLQQLWVGHFLGMAVAPHLFGYGDTPEFGIDPIPFATKAWRLLCYVEPANPQAPWAFAMILGGAACMGFAFARSRARASGLSVLSGLPELPDLRGLLAIGFAAALCGYLLLAQIGWHHAVIGLVASFPLFPLIAAGVGGLAPLANSARASDRRDERAVLRLVRDTALLFTALIVIAWPTYGGLQWGSRYLLPAYPLLTLAAAEGFVSRRAATAPKERRVWIAGSAALLAVALIFQAVGVHRRFAASDELSGTRRALQEMSVQLVATDRYFLPSLLASMMPEVVFLDVVGDAEIQALIPKAGAAGMNRIALVSKADRRLRLPRMIEEYRVVVTPGRDGRTLIELTRTRTRE